MSKIFERFQLLKSEYPTRLNVHQYGELVKPGKFYLTVNGDVVFLTRKSLGSCLFSNGKETFEGPEIYNFEVEPRCKLSLLPTVQATCRDLFSANYTYTMALILEFGVVADYYNVSRIYEIKDACLEQPKTIWQRFEIDCSGKVINFMSSENLDDLIPNRHEYKVGDEVEFFAEGVGLQRGKIISIDTKCEGLNFQVRSKTLKQTFWVAERKSESEKSQNWHIVHRVL